MDRLTIHLDAWIIQDGNYGDFARGDRCAFALAWSADTPLIPVASSPDLSPAWRHLGDARYEVLGRVVHVGADWWVIDIGVRAYGDMCPPADARPGDWLRGRLALGIDPFAWMERLAHLPEAPALTYDWLVEKIELQTAPLIEVAPRLMARDPAQLNWAEIAETDAWHDSGEYLLHCRRMGEARRPHEKRES